ncbi:MAG TPA: hypothetical protein VF149_01380 [Bacillales bacterium]
MRIGKGDLLQIIYEDRKGQLTQRFVRVLSITDDLLIAFCFYRKRPRSFARKNILAFHLERKTA